MKLTPFQWSALNFFGFYCAYGVVLPFLPVWFKSIGFDFNTIGLIIALSYLFRFAGGMLFSSRIQRLEQLIPMSRFLAWASLASLVLVGYFTQSIWAFLPAIGLFHMLNGGVMPISDTIASTWQKQRGMDYGKARLVGSIAFVVGSLLTGYLVKDLGEASIIWILAGFIFLFASGQMLRPNCKFEETYQKKTDSGESYWALLKSSTTCRVLLAVSLVQAGHAAYYAYGTLYWQSLGISTQATSWLWGIGVMAEIGLFFVARNFFSKTPIAHLVIVATLGSVVRWLIVGNSDNFALIVFSQLLHALSFALNHFAAIRYISSQPTEQMAKLQALYFGLGNCVIMAIFTFMAGFAYNLSPQYAFWLMVVLVLPALAILPKKLNVTLS